jgi:short-subunit dehydrogenase
MRLRRIDEQVMVITGATSGIGLTTARMAAEQGAQLLLIARNEEALVGLCSEINAAGGRAVHYAADVADERSLRDAARRAAEEFGRIDTWVNNAGVAIYGKIEDVSEEDARRLFETDFWGVVAGSRVAMGHLRHNGGALINVGSEVSDMVVPLLGFYCAAKHAVKGFTDTLRMEVEAEKLPISVTLIKPTAIHTPFPENAKNYMPFEPKLPPPVYAPELVAEAIIHCAQHPVRDFFVGEAAALHSAMATYTPRVNDMVMEKIGETSQDSGIPTDGDRRDGLHQTNSDLRERGSMDRFVMETSVYQKAKMHPMLTAGLVAGGGLALAALLGKRMTKTDGFDRHTRTRDDRVSMRGALVGSGLSISEHMEVVGSDGQHVGTVDHVADGRIKLTRNDPMAGGMHHTLPMDMVEAVESKRVRLNLPAEEARAVWRTA